MITRAAMEVEGSQGMLRPLDQATLHLAHSESA
jgi:hypothetical protein